MTVLRIALAVGIATLLVGAVAVLDHRHKRDVEFAAEEDAWFCAHGHPSACTDFDEIAYEARWEQRESAYRVTFIALGASGLGLTAFGLRRRHR